MRLTGWPTINEHPKCSALTVKRPLWRAWASLSRQGIGAWEGQPGAQSGQRARSPGLQCVCACVRLVPSRGILTPVPLPAHVTFTSLWASLAATGKQQWEWLLPPRLLGGRTEFTGTGWPRAQSQPCRHCFCPSPSQGRTSASVTPTWCPHVLSG